MIFCGSQRAAQESICEDTGFTESANEKRSEHAVAAQKLLHGVFRVFSKNK